MGSVVGFLALSPDPRIEFMQGYSIDSWLKGLQRSLGSHVFAIFDITEGTPRNDSTVTLLTDWVSRFLFHPQVMEDLWAQLGESARLALNAAIPSTSSLRSGVFGEALSAEICEQWHAYLVPLRRLRLTGGSPTGTDLLALKIGNNGDLSEICYIECKLRTTARPNAAAEAYEQLLRIRKERFPAITNYLANYLFQTNSHLYQPFMRYLTSRQDQSAADSFRIALTWEESYWSEDVLKNLGEKDVQLAPLTVDVIKIGQLRGLVQEVYDSLGIEVVKDGDQ